MPEIPTHPAPLPPADKLRDIVRTLDNDALDKAAEGGLRLAPQQRRQTVLATTAATLLLNSLQAHTLDDGDDPLRYEDLAELQAAASRAVVGADEFDQTAFMICVVSLVLGVSLNVVDQERPSTCGRPYAATELLLAVLHLLTAELQARSGEPTDASLAKANAHLHHAADVVDLLILSRPDLLDALERP